jgi:uncharacterized protein YqgC (DUF456 family)
MNLRCPKLKQLAILIAGWASILLGIIGILLPFVPGFAFVCAGLALLSSGSHWARTTLGRVVNCLPYKLRRVIETLPGVMPEPEEKT